MATTTTTPAGRFFIGERYLSDTQNRLSCIAYQGTAGIHEGSARIPVKELIDLLAERGVESPDAEHDWTAELPNGLKVGFKTGDVGATVRTAKPKADKTTRVSRPRGARAGLDRLAGLKAERQAVKDWEDAGSEGDKPATPLHDAAEAEAAQAPKRASVAPAKRALPRSRRSAA